MNKNKKIKPSLIILVVILTIISPFMFMGLVYLLDRVGSVLLGDVFRIISIDVTIKSSVYEYLYLYSQYLNVIVMGMLTLGLFIFAFRDFLYNHIDKAKIEMFVANYITIAVNKHTTRFHCTLSFKNNSKKSEVIEDVKLSFFVNGQEYKFYTENELITERVRTMDGGIVYDTIDLGPFSGTPIRGEDVIKKYVNFKMERYIDIVYEANRDYKLVFKYDDQEIKYKLVFSDDNILKINQFKSEIRSPESASNFSKTLIKDE